MGESYLLMGTYYIYIGPSAVYVKEGEFFKSQGGLVADWGKHWKPVEAKSIEHARKIGENRAIS